jgi:hypothetical protein
MMTSCMASGLDELDPSSEQPAGLAPQISITALSAGSVRARLQWVRRDLPLLPAAMLPADAQSSAAVNEVAVSEALAKIKARVPAAEVVAAWLKSLGPTGFEEAAAAPHAARAALRVAIVDMCSTCDAIDEDRHSGWKYTGAILRAFDAALSVLAPARGLKGE